MTSRIRVALADDHAIVRKGLLHILEEAKDLTVVGEASSADELLTLLRTHPVDLVVLDLTLGARNGIEVVKHVRSEFPGVRVLMLSMHPEDLFAARAIRAGASGYVQKDEAPEQLVQAIRRVAAGGKYISAPMARKLADELLAGDETNIPHERLSDREFEVFRLLGTGQAVSDIARALNLSPKTVSSHRARILEKMGLRNNAAIIEYVTTHQLR
jgi:DNA-binding NarL/FixJ family response regulator